MDSEDLFERYKYLVKEIKELTEIVERNEYDIILMDGFIDDLEEFLTELKELRENV